VQFWFDPAISGPLYATPGWLRIYGADSQGPGDPAARDPQDPACPVEVMPYTDPKAPFDPVAAQAPPNDSITFNPALLSEFVTDTDPLTRTLYPLISIQGHDAQEKVFFRTWYEPGYLDKVLTVTPTVTYTFPALQQEFTYMFLDTSMQPAAAPPGTSAFAFPIGMGQPMGGPGTGLTSFNADFDSKNDEVVHIHSEKTLAALTGIDADFTGDGKLDDLASAGAVSGDGLVVLTAEGLTLSVTNTEAMLLDHMVELKGVTPDGAAQLQIWDTGGDITEAPQRVGWPSRVRWGSRAATRTPSTSSRPAAATWARSMAAGSCTSKTSTPRTRQPRSSLAGPWAPQTPASTTAKGSTTSRRVIPGISSASSSTATNTTWWRSRPSL
jgi:hypothetical protein